MISNPVVKGTLVCVALNDSKQIEAMQAEFNEAPYQSAPTQPVLYFKPHNTWSTEGATVEWATIEGQPAESMVVGASLAVVFAKECCRAKPETAINYVAGYAIMHDFSLPEKNYYRPDIKGKCLDGSAPISAVVPVSDVVEPQELTVVTQVNGKLISEMPVSQMVRGVAELISTISYIMTLHPGDAIAIGFPGQRAMVSQGDKVSSTIAGLIELNNVVGRI